MKIGVHPMNLHLRLAEHWGGLFGDADVRFVGYPEGRDTGALIASGQIQAGGTGSTPPLISQSTGLPVTYLAASAPRPANGALLVAPGSEIRSIADLAGRHVAMIDGSFHTYLLARTLEQAGYALKDVTRIEMSPARSRAALIAGEVDVWVAMAPQIDAAIAAGEAELLTLCGSTIPNRSVFWTLESSGLTSDDTARLVHGLVQLGREVTAQPDRAARILAGPGASAREIAQWSKVVAGRDWTVTPANPALVAEQQAEADTLWKHGDFAARLEISAFIPTPDAA